MRDDGSWRLMKKKAYLLGEEENIRIGRKQQDQEEIET